MKEWKNERMKKWKNEKMKKWKNERIKEKIKEKIKEWKIKKKKLNLSLFFLKNVNIYPITI